MKPIEEELQQRKDKAKEKAEAIRAHIQQHPTATNKELADFFGCSTRTIQRLKASIQQAG